MKKILYYCTLFAVLHSCKKAKVNISPNAPVFEITLSSANPQPAIVQVSATSRTYGVQFLEFKLYAKDATIAIRKIVMRLHSSGDIESIINEVTLTMDGEHFSADLFDSTATFYDVDKVIEKGDKISCRVAIDVNRLGGNYLQGTLIGAEVITIDAVDQSNEPTELHGSAKGNLMELRSQGILVSLVSSVAKSIDGVPVFQIRYDVTAFGADEFIDTPLLQSPVARVGYGCTFVFERSDGLIVPFVEPIVTSSSSTASISRGVYYIEEGDTKRFTIMVYPGTAPVAGSYRLRLMQVMTRDQTGDGYFSQTMPSSLTTGFQHL